MAAEQLLLRDLTIAVAAAWIAGSIAIRLRLNPMLGYLAAGVCIGPFTPGYHADPSVISGLASLGLIFLLFSLGLDFSFEELRVLGIRAVAGNGAAMFCGCVAAWIGARALQMAHPVTAALTTAVSSTAVGAALLKDWREDTSRIGRFVISQQVVQDIVAVALLVITTLPMHDLTPARLIVPLLMAIAFVSGAVFIGHTVLQRIVHRTLGRASTERLFIAFTAISLIAAWLGEVAGLSYEFGAFVAGAVISEATGSKMIVSIIAPFRSLFVALFFISIGMLLDLQIVRTQWVTLALFTVGLLCIRALLWSLIGKRMNLGSAGAWAGALAMASLGEFNVVLVNEAAAAARIDDAEKQLLLAATLLSIIITFSLGPVVSRLLAKSKATIEPPEGAIIGRHPQVTLIGYGRVGRTVGSILREAEIPFAALEHDKRALRDVAVVPNEVVFGDALDPMALDRVITSETRIVVTTSPLTSVNMAVTRHVANRYDVQIIARAAAITDIATLTEHGAHIAYVPEAEGAFVFAESVLAALAFEPQDIERRIQQLRISQT